jgi:2-dehydro-3-deoxy-D-gluconate 5-dehydrogenase
VPNDHPGTTLLAGMAVIVTGASRGIGRATALRLAELGADVALLQRSPAEETVAAIEAHGRQACLVQVDLSDAPAAQAAVTDAAEALGRLDAAVCNAGIILRRPALELSLDEWNRTLAVNLTGAFAVAQAAGRIIVSRGTPGSIVLTASVLSFQGGLNTSAYAASKGGVLQLTRALANEWAPLGIRVNAVAPGYVENENTEPLRQDPVRYEEISRRIPAGRWASDAEIADGIAFLLGPNSSYVNGHALVIDGGWLGR